MGQLAYLSEPMPGSLLAGQQVMLEGEEGGADAGSDADLLVGVGDVVPDGEVGDHEPGRDLLVGQALREQGEHIVLARHPVGNPV